jgi:hypothetical protein
MSEVRAMWDGKPKRAPKAGEWFLSGAIIEAYQARADMSTPYHIASLVKGQGVTRWVPIKEASQ